MICPICNWQGESFLSKNGRSNVICPKCGAFERHRHQYYACTQAGLLQGLNGRRVLHIGPELCEVRLLSNAGEYLCFDMKKSRAMVSGDMCYMPFETEYFDFLWASHVLEHIKEVKRAILEAYRVLKSGGAALFDVPIYGEKTKRLIDGDRHGHVWHPGKDWPQHYVDVGFKVDLYWGDHCPACYGPLIGSLVAICWK